jgi:D-amino-acid oxidase
VSKAALVIGAGVSGLTTALVLRRYGWRVTVVAEQFGSDLVSTVAGALWEWPPSVCGRHHDETLLERSKAWAAASYERFEELAEHSGRTGVYFRPAVSYFHRPLAEQPLELAKMRELAAFVPGFTHDPGLIPRNGVNPLAGVRDAYRFKAPMVDTDRYLAWLLTEALRAGCRLQPGRVTENLREQEARLRRKWGADVVVNCAGLGARELADDAALSPHRGALIRVRNDGRAMPRITTAHIVANDVASEEQDMIFILPRGQDRLLLGGLVEPDEWDTDLTLDSYAPLRDILDRCAEFLPALRDAELDPADPVRVGLRPFRAGSARLEVEPGSRIVHNYGHGGAGVTLSWGCADEAVRIADGPIGKSSSHPVTI